MECSDCWAINEGDEGDCSSVRGCTSSLCNFCTNDSDAEEGAEGDDDKGDDDKGDDDKGGDDKGGDDD